MVQNTKRYTVITGASSGIGYETSKAFAARESNLIDLFPKMFLGYKDRKPYPLQT